MPVIHPSLFLIMKHFPGHEDILRRMYIRNETFKSICNDYQKCAEAVEYWKRSNLEKAPLRADEYATLLMELEEEICEYLVERS
jgi:hypothetical protein